MIYEWGKYEVVDNWDFAYNFEMALFLQGEFYSKNTLHKHVKYSMKGECEQYGV